MEGDEKEQSQVEKQEEKVEEEKEEKGRKGMLMGLSPMQLLLLIVVILLFFGAAFATSHFKRLARDLDYNIKVNSGQAMQALDNEDIDEDTEEATEEGELVEEEDEVTPTPEADVQVDIGL